MTKLSLCLMALALFCTGCSKDPLAIQSAASEAFESGDTQKAIAILDGYGDSKEYVIGHFLAFLHMREQFYAKAPSGNRKAIEILQDVDRPPEANRRLIRVYLDVLMFDALANDGNTSAADQVMETYCPRTMGKADRRLWIRNRIAQPLLHLYQDEGKDSRYYKELLAMSRLACTRVYGWDLLPPLNGSEA